MIEEFPMLVECNHCGADHDTTVYVTIDGWGEPVISFDEIGECDECGFMVDNEVVEQYVFDSCTSLESELIRIWQNER